MEDLAVQGPIIGLTIQRQMIRGLLLLRQASDYAEDLKRDAWDFAVEISALRDVGMTNSDFRWLVCRSTLSTVGDHRDGKRRAEFRCSGELTFGQHTCFVLTEAGAGSPETQRKARPLQPPWAASEKSEVRKGKAVAGTTADW